MEAFNIANEECRIISLFCLLQIIISVAAAIVDNKLVKLDQSVYTVVDLCVWPIDSLCKKQRILLFFVEEPLRHLCSI